MTAQQHTAFPGLSMAQSGVVKHDGARKPLFAKLRTLALLGLMVLGILFAPLGQGVGLSAGQELYASDSPLIAASAMASTEVQRLIDRR